MTEIYLDSAATSLHKPPQVARAVAEAICTAGNAARGAHGASMAASRTVYDTRCLAARLLGCPGRRSPPGYRAAGNKSPAGPPRSSPFRPVFRRFSGPR